MCRYILLSHNTVTQHSHKSQHRVQAYCGHTPAKAAKLGTNDTLHTSQKWTQEEELWSNMVTMEQAQKDGGTQGGGKRG